LLKRFGLALVALALAFGAQAAPAAAEGEADTGAFGAFRLKGSNGYSALVMALSRPRFKHGEILVIVGRRAERGFESVLYFAPAKVLPETIDADLGPVGEISVRFEPSGPPERVHASCKRGGSVTYEPGAWVGTIEFTGEEGFTEAHVSRSKAIPSPFLDAGCGATGIGETSGHGVRGARLIARSATAKRAIYLQANKNHQNARVRVEASVDERRGKLIVSREVARFFPVAAFDFDSSLRSAELSPSVPFSGSASFHRNAKPANRWTGNLSVDLPGRANVSLAGYRFKSVLGHWERSEERRTYDRSRRPSLLPWPSTKPSPIASAMSSPLALR
jgi:hypothetical protein